MINPDFADSILRLANLCTVEKIPHAISICNDGLRLRFPWTCGEIVCNSHSLGSEAGFVESYGFSWNKKKKFSCLFIDEALYYLSQDYEAFKKNNF